MRVPPKKLLLHICNLILDTKVLVVAVRASKIVVAAAEKKYNPGNTAFLIAAVKDC